MFSNVGFGSLDGDMGTGDMLGQMAGDDVLPLLGPGDYSTIEGLGAAQTGGAGGPAKKRVVKRAPAKPSASAKFAEKFADTALATTADIVSARLKPKQPVAPTIINQGPSTKKIAIVTGLSLLGGVILYFLVRPKNSDAKVA